jgi:hypothetical protein
VNGHPVHDPAEMKFRMAMVPLGAPADFSILRRGAAQTIHVAAAAPPDVPPRNETRITGYNPLSGVRVANINPAVAVELGITQEEGVVVTDTSTAQLRVVSPGDIIENVNGQAVKTVAALKSALAPTGQGWSIVISRDGQKRQIVIR